MQADEVQACVRGWHVDDLLHGFADKAMQAQGVGAARDALIVEFALEIQTR